MTTKVLRILAACEKSLTISTAFRALGHDAYSCDLKPCLAPAPAWYIQGDVTPLLKEYWDLIIATPLCTHLSGAGASHWPQKQKDGRQKAAIAFFKLFMDCNCEQVCCENPQGILNTVYRTPDQTINPFNFGDPFRKRTCLWLKGLPPLIHTTPDATPPSPLGYDTRGRAIHWCTSLPGNKSRADIRSRTFPGIAAAMAWQWSSFILSL